ARAYVTYSEAIGGRKLFFKSHHRSAWTEARDHPMQGCLPFDTRILTPNGWQCIGEFTEGLVWTGNNWAKAVKVHRGRAHRMRLHLNDGNIFDCDDRHYLLGYNGGAWPDWLSVDEVIGKELVRDYNTLWGIQFREIEEWYWVGRILGDGWVGKERW